MSNSPAHSPAAAVGRTNSIGFLRLLFAGFVIYGHAYFLAGAGPDPLGSWTGGTMFFGKLGVQAFFVLSGYLVARSYQHSPSIPRYLWHRFLRLAPAYWACLLVTVFVIAPLLFYTSASTGSFLGQNPSPLGYLTSNFLFPRGQLSIGELLAGNPNPSEINGSLWTLFYEASCYLLVIVLGLAGLLTRRRKAGFVLILGLLAVFVLWSVRPSLFPGLVGRLFDTEGKLLCLHFLGGTAWAVLPEGARFRWLLRGPLALLAGGLLLAGYHWNFHQHISVFALPPLVFWLAEHLPMKNYEQRLGGDYSYGLYVYGYPIQQTLAHFGVHKLGLLTYGLAALLISLLLAVLSWHLVEKPALRLKSFSFAS